MKKLARYKITELSLHRIIAAIKTRVSEIPHSLAWNFHPSAKINKEKINKFKNLHKGNRCFIIANGPSLTKTKLEKLQSEITFGMNRIYLNFETSPFRPTYYLTANELILEQFANEISELPMPKFLNWNRRKLYTFDDSNTCFLKSKLVVNDFFQTDLTQPMVVGASVTFAALQLAYYMGFQQVILIGLDHNYAEKGTPNQTETRTQEKDASHFHPQYFPKGIKWQLPDLQRSEYDFAIARQIYEQDGREILDATIGGKSHVFKKVEFSSLFSS